MKKKIVLLLLVMFFITGCNMVSNSTSEIDLIVDKILLKNNQLSNTFFEGYKYYVPRGLTFIEKEEFNAILKDQYQNHYYLYVDAVSYYHKVKNKYKERRNSYYSRSIKKGKDFGYIEINEVDGKYFIGNKYTTIVHL